MKRIYTLIVGALLLQASFAVATSPIMPSTPEASAFAKDGVLYVTVLADTCNAKGASLIVNKFCDKDRTTKNLAPSCSADLMIISTTGACLDQEMEPKVFKIKLAETQVAPEARTLDLRVGNDILNVEIR